MWPRSQDVQCRDINTRCGAPQDKPPRSRLGGRRPAQFQTLILDPDGRCWHRTISSAGCTCSSCTFPIQRSAHLENFKVKKTSRVPKSDGLHWLVNKKNVTPQNALWLVSPVTESDDQLPHRTVDLNPTHPRMWQTRDWMARLPARNTRAPQWLFFYSPTSHVTPLASKKIMGSRRLAPVHDRSSVTSLTSLGFNNISGLLYSLYAFFVRGK